MHNKLVIIELGMWWRAVMPIYVPQWSWSQNRHHHGDALNPGNAGIQRVSFQQCEQRIQLSVEIMHFTVTLLTTNYKAAINSEMALSLMDYS